MANDPAIRSHERTPTTALPSASANWAETRRRLFHGALHQMIQGLEDLRKRLHERIDQIEALAIQQAIEGESAKPTRRERELEKRVAELEEALRKGGGTARSDPDMESWYEKKDVYLSQMERDRKLLSEAWERLEQERVRASATSSAALPSLAAARAVPPGMGMHRLADQPTEPEPTDSAEISSIDSAAHGHGHGQGIPQPPGHGLSPAPAPGQSPGPGQGHPPSAKPTQPDVVARAVRRQFEALQRDVRRNL